MGSYDTRGGAPRHDPAADHFPVCDGCGLDPYDCTCPEEEVAMKSTPAERMAQWRMRERAKGMTEVVVRVPAEHAETIRRLAAELRGEKETQP